ncbi:MAG: hypothetical protein KBD53_09695 [Candidatus Omnitrophica bacterium]|nr:hypothetical protein [Candidatus Omnitrophota bacterium]
MIKMKNLFLILIVFVLSGCATSYKMNNITLDMTRDEVVKILGKPVSTSAEPGVELLNYKFSETSTEELGGKYTPYYVRIVDGKVESYGRVADMHAISEAAE